MRVAVPFNKSQMCENQRHLIMRHNFVGSGGTHCSVHSNSIASSSDTKIGGKKRETIIINK